MMINDTDEENDDDMMNILPCVQVKMEADDEDCHDDSTYATIQKPIEQVFVKGMPDNYPYILMDSDIYSESVEAEADSIADPRNPHFVTEGINIKEGLDYLGRITYICIACDMSYMRRDMLIHHMTVDHKGLAYLCSICHKIFSSNENLKQHVNIHLNISLREVCEICGLVLSTKRSLENHLMKHAAESNKKVKSLICNMCHEVFTDVNSFSHHTLTHKNMMLSCKLCQFWCDSDVVYQEHLKKHNDKEVYSCNKCEKTFQTRNDLHFHKKTSNCNKTNNCRAEKSSKEAFCSKCEVVLRSKKDLTLHKKSSDCKTFYCSNCYSSFTNLNLYNNHADQCSKKIVKSKRTLECDLCGEKFRNNCNLQKHRSAHTQQLLSCKICGKVYNYNRALTKHIRQHSEEPPDKYRRSVK